MSLGCVDRYVGGGGGGSFSTLNSIWSMCAKQKEREIARLMNSREVW